MEYGRLIVLGYSSYRVESSASNSVTSESSGSTSAHSGGGTPSRGPTSRRPDRRAVGEFWEPIGDQNAQYTLTQRKSGNGIKLRRFHHFYDPKLREEAKDKAAKGDLKVVTRRLMLAIEGRSKGKHSELDSRNGTTGNGSYSSVKNESKSYLLCVPMADADAHASVVEYVDDDATDMFQIGRMPCGQNDVVIPGPRVGASGTISRFAARILCSRTAPYECRIFAGGFDGARRMTTAGHALKRCASCGDWLKLLPADHKCIHDLLETKADTGNQTGEDAGENAIDGLQYVAMELDDPQRVPIDGLTKNGVRVWLPDSKQWFEVSVNGNFYAIAPRESSKNTSQRSANNPFMSVRHSAFNRPTEGISQVPGVLSDGAIIDMGGVWLQFQSQWSLPRDCGDRSVLRASISVYADGADQRRVERVSESSLASKLDRMNVHCPVQLHPLRFIGAETDGEVQFDQVPHVFPSCGHVFGYDQRIAASRMCPLCRHAGSFVRLLLKENFQLLSRAERQAVPECVFNPCGHAISSKLATHYASLLMPNGRSICPFCAVHLDPAKPFSKLFFYSEQGSESSGEGSSSDDASDETTHGLTSL